MLTPSLPLPFSDRFPFQRLSFRRRAGAAVLSGVLLSSGLTLWAGPVQAQALPHATNPRPAATDDDADGDEDGPDWKAAVTESLQMVFIQHAARITFQPKTREELGGPFFKDYRRSLGFPRGWSDGDGWLVNHVGHPIQGAAAARIWVANDPKSRREEFGMNRDYWTTRWRALAWSAGYSVQFEIGPLSEASIGNVGLDRKTIGWTDHVITPIGGTALMVAEDALDRYVVLWLERRTSSSALRAVYRVVLNPARTLANVSRRTSPWHRDARSLRQLEMP